MISREFTKKKEIYQSFNKSHLSNNQNTINNKPHIIDNNQNTINNKPIHLQLCDCQYIIDYSGDEYILSDPTLVMFYSHIANY